jgi:glutaminyl-tRNA synthetase
VAKKDSWIGLDWLEKATRDDLNPSVKRVMAVLDPLEVEIMNLPEGEERVISAPYFPDEPDKFGHRDLMLTRHIFIEKDDFMLEPIEGYRRLSPGREVRLRWTAYIKCISVEKDESGKVTKLNCELNEEPTTVDAKGKPVRPNIIHWVSAKYSRPAKVRLYDKLFKVPRPTGDLEAELNPDSLIEKEGRLEWALADVKPWDRFQFERLGYFMVDPKSVDATPVFNRIVTLKDSWAKANKAKETKSKETKGKGK